MQMKAVMKMFKRMKVYWNSWKIPNLNKGNLNSLNNTPNHKSMTKIYAHAKTI
jgi:hypothetical protein